MDHYTEVKPHPAGGYYAKCSCGYISLQYVAHADALGDAKVHQSKVNPEHKEKDR